MTDPFKMVVTTKAGGSSNQVQRRTDIVCCSVFANPLNKGHLALFRSAAKFGQVYVIVNNDAQVALKGRVPFMNQDDRLEIVKAIRWVDNAMIAIDTDDSVAKTITHIKPDYFLNAGDRGPQNYHPKEVAACHEIDCMVLYEFCPKIASSSELIKNACEKYNQIYKKVLSSETDQYDGLSESMKATYGG